MDLKTVAAIVATTLTIVQFIKGWPYLEKIPTKVLAVVIGAILTVIAFYTGQIQGNLYMLIISVVLAVIGAPALYEIVAGAKAKLAS